MSADLATIRALVDEHESFRASCLNLIASENVMSGEVAAVFGGDLSGRYADYDANDPGRRKYRGGAVEAQIESLCVEIASRVFRAEAFELRSLSGHVAGAAVLLGLCDAGDLVLEVGSEGGGHRLAEKTAQARLIELDVAHLPFDAAAMTVDGPAAAALIRERHPRVVVLGSSSFVRPHPVGVIAEACRDTGSVLVYDSSHVLGFVAAGRFQDPLREGADLVVSSTHKTLPGPPGGIIFGARDLVDAASSALYPSLVTSHHPHRIPALAVALAEHEQFGSAYADATVENARTFSSVLADDERLVPGAPTQSHTVLLAVEDATGDALRLERNGIICNPCRLPAQHGGQGLRFGLQELTRRGGLVGDAAAAARLTCLALRGQDVRAAVAALASSLDGIAFAWSDR